MQIPDCNSKTVYLSIYINKQSYSAGLGSSALGLILYLYHSLTDFDKALNLTVCSYAMKRAVLDLSHPLSALLVKNVSFPRLGLGVSACDTVTVATCYGNIAHHYGDGALAGINHDADATVM